MTVIKRLIKFEWMFTGRRMRLTPANYLGIVFGVFISIFIYLLAGDGLNVPTIVVGAGIGHLIAEVIAMKVGATIIEPITIKVIMKNNRPSIGE